MEKKLLLKKENPSAKYWCKSWREKLLLNLKEKTSAKYGIKSGFKNSAKREKPSAKNGVNFGEKTLFIYIYSYSNHLNHNLTLDLVDRV